MIPTFHDMSMLRRSLPFLTAHTISQPFPTTELFAKPHIPRYRDRCAYLSPAIELPSVTTWRTATLPAHLYIPLSDRDELLMNPFRTFDIPHLLQLSSAIFPIQVYSESLPTIIASAFFATFRSLPIVQNITVTLHQQSTLNLCQLPCCSAPTTLSS
jgi:hypothetical protein